MNTISLETIVKPVDASFCAVTYQNAYFAAPLHIHPEYELILIEKGYGLSFVGDKVHKMAPGDFMLIGRNIPHLWLSADEYYDKENTLISASVYSQFNVDIFPVEHVKMPEFESIRLLLKKSQRGLLFVGKMQQKTQAIFRSLPSCDNFEKLLRLYNVLYELSQECEYTFLSTDKYRGSYLDEGNSPILKRAVDYMNKNYQESITLEDIANYAGMNPSALCRYYKKNTGKTMFEYLAELRISYAAKLLINKNMSITQIAYDCGYNNLSHFNRQFKSIVGKTPSEYCKLLHDEKSELSSTMFMEL